jgi:phosphatidylserine/phosphatidylglycerophosphate/cardiolipin synthase-like enzyme
VLTAIKVQSYLSPTLVLLAFDWPDGSTRHDFLGFGVERRPGFDGESRSWLPNRIGWDGAPKAGERLPSDRFPIQKFMWWDARIDTKDRGRRFTYRVVPIVGTRDDLQEVREAETSITLTVPREVANGIGSYFNRAVVSSQAFIRAFGDQPEGKTLERALVWLANGMEAVVPAWLKGCKDFAAAIYHLTDDYWVIPALRAYRGSGSVVYHDKKIDRANRPTVRTLRSRRRLSFHPRTRGKLMHNKFVVQMRRGRPAAVLTGSANFTTKALTSQANLMHTWRSPKLAALFRQRQELLANDPPPSQLRGEAGWSDPVKVGDATVRVFFAPEPTKSRAALDEIVRAVKKARRSVIFCLFSSTDKPLRDACFAAADAGKMMFGLVNAIARPKAGAADTASTRASVAIYDRSTASRDVYAHDAYSRGTAPPGFWWEVDSIRVALHRATDDAAPDEAGQRQPPEVYIHHKFVLVDAETDHPIIFTGSANLSDGSTHGNDENLLEIRRCPRLARMYLAEFLRLYEHYRARAQFNRRPPGHRGTPRLQTETRRWAWKYYQRGSPEYRCRVNMVGG